ncbi:MAG: aspartate kinase, partial [Pyrinomonadaceae bacterium]|nr:aspartate kinase [Pyrinomonadaceae bacterium]
PKPIVIKFGGTSVEDESAFARVAQIVGERKLTAPVVVVTSAMSRMTDALLASFRTATDGRAAAAFHLLDEHYERHSNVALSLLAADAADVFIAALEVARDEVIELLRNAATRPVMQPLLQDVVVSHGERLAATLLTAVLNEQGLPAQYTDARRFIVTDDEHAQAAPLLSATERQTRRELGSLLGAGKIPVLGGFIGASLSGATTTLGRGGSDYTATLVGAAVHAREIEIWTDVSGAMTTDPRLVPAARTIPHLSYEEAATLAYFGGKVLHPKTVQPIVAQGIPLRILNSRAPEDLGTIVNGETEQGQPSVKAITHKTNITTVQIKSAHAATSSEFLCGLFETFKRYHAVVDLAEIAEASVALAIDDTGGKLPLIVRELEPFGSVRVKEHCAIVCVIGEGVSRSPGIAARIFSALDDVQITLAAQGASGSSLAFVVDTEQAREVVVRLHGVFFEHHVEDAEPTAAMAAV